MQSWVGVLALLLFHHWHLLLKFKAVDTSLTLAPILRLPIFFMFCFIRMYYAKLDPNWSMFRFWAGRCLDI